MIDFNSMWCRRIAFIVWSYLHFLGYCFLRILLHMVLSNRKHFLNRCIWYIDGSLRSTKTPGPSGLGSYGNEGVLHTCQIFQGRNSSAGAVYCHTKGGGVLPLCWGDAVSIFYPLTPGCDKKSKIDSLRQ